MTWAPCRKRTGEAVPPPDKIGDLITADHKVPEEEGAISKQSQVRCRGTKFSHSMETIFSV